jgi:hypothetical protein
VQLTTVLQLVTKLRMHGGILAPPPYTFIMQFSEYEKIYLYKNF